LHFDYPGERLIACRNPALAALRAHKRAALLVATETELAKIAAAVTAGRLVDAAAIGTRFGKIIGRYKMGKHFTVHIAERVFTATRNHTAIDAEAALDGIYVIRTSVPATALPTDRAVATYKSSPGRTRLPQLKAIDLSLRPIHHYTETRVRAHVFLCMLAAYLVWHLRQAWAPLTFRRERARTRRPHRPRETLTHRAHQSIPSNRPRRSARAFLPVAPRSPRHLDPQRHPLRHQPGRGDRAHPHHRHHHATPYVRAPARHHSPDPDVARTTTPQTGESPAQQGIHASPKS